MSLQFRAFSEASPGPVWAGLFAEFWPHYRRWWASEGVAKRPNYRECRDALQSHMPEIVMLYDELCELAGGGDNQARYLSFYNPPPYLFGCSQAIWQGERPLLVRNYDYNANAFDAILLHSSWQGRQIIGMSDGMFGLIDGMNDAGLALSLTFGGRREVGQGFAVPLILRYILQCCSTLAEAEAILRRVPCHMSYNVTVMDSRKRYFTAYLTPDRPTVIARTPVATNHQQRVEWFGHARFTATVKRERFLTSCLNEKPGTEDGFIDLFLHPPLYSTSFSKGFGTLYTAAYMPGDGEMRLSWPQKQWRHSFADFKSGMQVVPIV